MPKRTTSALARPARRSGENRKRRTTAATTGPPAATSARTSAATTGGSSNACARRRQRERRRDEQLSPSLGQSPAALAQLVVLALEALEAHTLFLEAVVESPHGGECNAVSVDRVVRLVCVPEAKGRSEVLRHWPEVTYGGVVALVRPRRDGHLRDSLEHGLFVGGLDVAFEISIADTQGAPFRARVLAIPRRVTPREDRGASHLRAADFARIAAPVATTRSRPAGRRLLRARRGLPQALAVRRRSAACDPAAPTVVRVVDRGDAFAAATIVVQ